MAAGGDLLGGTYLYYDSTEGLGFGLRHAGPCQVYHDFRRGLGLVLENLSLLNRWLFGFNGSLFAAAGLAIVGWSRRWSPLLLMVAGFVWLDYIFNFGRTINNCGPYYYFETLPFILAACGLGIARLWRSQARQPVLRNVVAALVAASWLGAALAFMVREGWNPREEQAHDARLLGLIRSARFPDHNTRPGNADGADHAESARRGQRPACCRRQPVG